MRKSFYAWLAPRQLLDSWDKVKCCDLSEKKLVDVFQVTYASCPYMYENIKANVYLTSTIVGIYLLIVFFFF